jgi:polyphosphate kinase
MEVQRYAAFRVTRDADFDVSDEADDLLRAVEQELRQRRFGEVVRLEVGSEMDAYLRSFLIEQLRVEENEVEDVDGLLDLSDLWEICGIDGFQELREEPWKPVSAGPFAADDGKPDVLAAMRAGDRLVHHPYDSFASSVERLVEQSVNDPDVLAIKMTVYRTSDDSELVPLLIKAAERGKQAVCLVELKARFDERPTWSTVFRGSRRMQRHCWWCAGRATACATTCTSAPATTTPRPPACTRTSACSPRTGRSPPMWRRCSTP